MGVSSMLADCTYKKTIQASLVLLNVITLAFSLTLIGLAAPNVGYERKGSTHHMHGGANSVLDDPYAALCLFGAITGFISLLGVLGGIRANKTFLVFYFALLLAATAMLLYAAVLCLVFKAEADYYVSSYWEKYENSMPESWSRMDAIRKAHKVLEAAGALCATVAAIDLYQLYAASVIMGHEYALARSVQIINFFSFVMGVGVAYVAVECIRRKVGGDWAPGMMVTLAICTIILSCTGFVQSFGEKTHRVAVFHLVACVVILVLTIACAVAAFAEGQKTKRWVDDHWDKIGSEDITQKQVHDWWQAHATLLGVACCFLAISLILNIVGSSYFIHTTRRSRREGGADAVSGTKSFANAAYAGGDAESAEDGMLNGEALSNDAHVARSEL